MKFIWGGDENVPKWWWQLDNSMSILKPLNCTFKMSELYGMWIISQWSSIITVHIYYKLYFSLKKICSLDRRGVWGRMDTCICWLSPFAVHLKLVHHCYRLHPNTKWASLMAQMVKNLLAMQETQVQFLGQEDPLETGIAIHSSILAQRIPWTKKPWGI